MTKYTAAEREEIEYELWLMNDGPRKATEKHLKFAEESIVGELTENGWEVLHKELIKEFMMDTKVLELVVRRRGEIKTLRWKPFNKGWMEKYESGGWGIFRPVKDERTQKELLKALVF